MAAITISAAMLLQEWIDSGQLASPLRDGAIESIAEGMCAIAGTNPTGSYSRVTTVGASILASSLDSNPDDKLVVLDDWLVLGDCRVLYHDEFSHRNGLSGLRAVALTANGSGAVLSLYLSAGNLSPSRPEPGIAWAEGAGFTVVSFCTDGRYWTSIYKPAVKPDAFLRYLAGTGSFEDSLSFTTTTYRNFDSGVGPDLSRLAEYFCELAPYLVRDHVPLQQAS